MLESISLHLKIAFRNRMVMGLLDNKLSPRTSPCLLSSSLISSLSVSIGIVSYRPVHGSLLADQEPYQRLHALMYAVKTQEA
jgi:hypothetical protein